jgi:uncharacterized protein (DUF1697 family)
MTKYAAFLRGINVGGRIIKMAELKVCLEKLGFKDVTTLLQSGNVIFESASNQIEAKKQIEQSLTKTFNYPAKVWVLPLAEIEQIVNQNPFVAAPKDFHQYVIFFENGLEKEFVKETVDTTGEAVKEGKGVAYWKTQKGQTLKSARGKLLAKTKYRDFNTNRNVNTLQRIIQKAL